MSFSERLLVFSPKTCNVKVAKSSYLRTTTTTTKSFFLIATLLATCGFKAHV